MISMDKKYRTRDGRDVRLLCVDGPREAPVIGLADGEADSDGWSLSGQYSLCDRETNWDLIEYHEPDIRTIWVNVYEQSVKAFNTKDAAEFFATETHAISVAQPVTFEVKRD